MQRRPIFRGIQRGAGEQLLEARDLRAVERAAFHDDDGVGLSVKRAHDLDAVDGGEVAIRKRRRILVDEPDRLAQAFEREPERDLRSDRVAVRPRV